MPGLKPLKPRRPQLWRVSFLLLIVALLGAAGCTTVTVLNVSDLNARVLIYLPDSTSGISRAIDPGSTADSFSSFGGTVTIQTVPDEAYRELLVSVRDNLILRLFEEAETLTGEEVAALVNRLSQMDDALEQLSQEGASCTVSAPDFSSVSAVLSWDASRNNWVLSCSVETFEE